MRQTDTHYKRQATAANEEELQLQYLSPEMHEEEADVTAATYALPKDKWLPLIIRELMRNAPEPFKAATFFAAATCLSCVATRIRVYYPYDGPNEHALLFQTIITGEQSSGKSFVRNNVEKILMAHLRRRILPRKTLNGLKR